MFAFQTFFFLLLNIFKCLSRWGVTLAKEKHEIPLIKSRLCCQAFPRSSITGMWQPRTSDSNPCWCQEDNSALYSHKDSTFLTPSLTNLCADILPLWFCPSPISKPERCIEEDKPLCSALADVFFQADSKGKEWGCLLHWFDKHWACNDYAKSGRYG